MGTTWKNNRDRGTNGLSRRRAFTLIELLVTIGVVLVLSALLAPMATGMLREGKKTQCISNLRAIATGFSRFLGENNNRYPGNGESSSKYFRWICRVGPYMDLEGPITTRTSTNGERVEVLDNAFNQAVFHCPVTNPKEYRGTASMPLESMGVYGAQNVVIATEVPPGDVAKPPTGPWGINALTVSRPSKTVLLADRYAGTGTGTPAAMGANLATSATYPAQKAGASANHRRDGNPAADPLGAGASNFLFCDGHVETVDLKKLRPYIGKSGDTSGYTFNP